MAILKNDLNLILENEKLEKGIQKLNGEQALALARNRKKNTKQIIIVTACQCVFNSYFKVNSHSICKMRQS